MKISAIIPSAEVVAVLAGITVPCLVFGRVVMAVPLILAALVLVWLPGRQRYWRALCDQAGTPIGMMVLVTLALWLPGTLSSPLPLRSLEAWIRVPIFVGFIVYLAAMLSERRETLALALKALMVAGAIATVFALCSLTFLPEVLAFARRSGWSAMPYLGFRAHDILKPYAALSVLMAPVLVWAGWRTGAGWRGVAVATVVGLLAVVCAESARIRPGDRLRIEAERGMVSNLSTGDSYACEPLPAHLLEMVGDGGLMPHLKKKLAKR